MRQFLIHNNVIDTRHIYYLPGMVLSTSYVFNLHDSSVMLMFAPLYT